MKLKRTAKILMLTAVPLLALACGDTDMTAEMTGALSEDSVEGSRSPFFRLTQALKKLDLREDQRVTLDALIKTTQEKMVPLRAARTAGTKELARQIRLGALDQGQLDRQAEQLRAAFQGVSPTIVQALNTLHRTLDPAQRQKLVTFLQKRHEKRHFGHRRHTLKKLAKKIGLTDDQIDSLRELMKAHFKGHGSEMRGNHKEHRAQLQAAAEAFKSEKFDANRLPIFNERMAQFKPHLKRFMQIAGQVLPLLTPEQREKLAVIIEKKGLGMKHPW